MVPLPCVREVVHGGVIEKGVEVQVISLSLDVVARAKIRLPVV